MTALPKSCAFDPVPPSGGAAGPVSPGDCSGAMAGQLSDTPADVRLLPRGPVAGAALDPHRVAREWPERWSAYVRAHFRSTAEVCYLFSVDDRTARKWWNAEGGARGDKVVLAASMHPEGVVRYLFSEA